jgi:FAD synthase
MQEPWLLHDFAGDFYGEDLRLVVVGYIRPEVLLYTMSNAIRLSYN